MNKKHRKNLYQTKIRTAVLLLLALTLALSGIGLAEEPEGARDFVARMYRTVLNREPDEDGLASWTQALEEGSLSASDLVEGFFNSPEYANQAKSNQEVVTDCYQAMLDRAPDEAGMAAWTQMLDVGMTPQVLFSGFVGSPEFTNLSSHYGIQTGTVETTAARDQNYERTYFVYRLYQNCLERQPETSGQEAWCQALNDGAAGSSTAYGFVFSPESWNRHLDNTQFVDMLYSTMLGRAADEAGKAGWVNLLDNTNTREYVLNGFIFSPEFLNQCERAEIHVGSPIEEPDGTPAWQANVEMLARVNEVREEAGKKKLTTREDLWRDVAQVRAEETASEFSHTRPDGDDWDVLLDEKGMYQYTAAGEVIGNGTDDAGSVLAGWLENEEDRNIILSDELESLATAYHPDSQSWVQSYYTPDRAEPKALSAMDKLELERAADLGISLDQAGHSRLSGKDTVALLDQLIARKAPEKTAEWKQQTAGLRKSGGTMTRLDYMATLYLASTLLGEAYQGTNFFPYWQNRLENPWENISGTSRMLWRDDAFSRTYNIGYGDSGIDVAGYYYNLGHISPISGEFPVAEDPAEDTVHAMDPITGADAILGIVRLTDAAENRQGLAEEEDQAALEALFDEEILKIAESAETVDAEHHPVWNGFVVFWTDDSTMASEKLWQDFSKWGFNAVRLQMDYRLFFDQDDTGYVANYSNLRKLDTLVAAAVRNGLHLNLCFNDLPGYYSQGVEDSDTFERTGRSDLFTNEEQQALADQVLETVLKRYAQIPNAYLSCWPMGELNGWNTGDGGVDIYTSEEMGRYYRHAVETIRKADPDRLILYEAGGVTNENALREVKEALSGVDNLMVQYNYAGAAFVYFSMLFLDSDDPDAVTNADDQRHSLRIPSYPTYVYGLHDRIDPENPLTMDGPIPAGTKIRINLRASEAGKLQVQSDGVILRNIDLQNQTAETGGLLSWLFPYKSSNMTLEIEIPAETENLVLTVSDGSLTWCGMDVILPEIYARDIAMYYSAYDVALGLAEEDGTRMIRTSTIQIAPYEYWDGSEIHLDPETLTYSTDCLIEEASRQQVEGWGNWMRTLDGNCFVRFECVTDPLWKDIKAYYTDFLSMCRENRFSWWSNDLDTILADYDGKRIPDATVTSQDGYRCVKVDLLHLLQEYQTK